MEQQFNSRKYNDLLITTSKAKLSQDRFRKTVGKSVSFSIRPNQLLAADILKEINEGTLPDFQNICYQLIDTFSVQNFPFKATQFINALSGYELSEKDKSKLLVNPRKKHVLIENDLIKIVVIRWDPGEYYPIHGHPSGGCVFKVLEGTLTEERYHSSYKTKLLARTEMLTGALSYIEDSIAFHSIENQHEKIGISIHVYTPGKSKKK